MNSRSDGFADSHSTLAPCCKSWSTTIRSSTEDSVSVCFGSKQKFNAILKSDVVLMGASSQLPVWSMAIGFELTMV